MSKIKEYDFTTTGGIVATFSHEAETARLKVVIKEVDGTCNTLHFNNIGEGSEPIEFFSELDWGYIEGKIFGNAGRTPDFLKTVACMYTQMHDYANYGFEEETVEGLTHILKRTMAHYDGNDELACTMLVSSMRNSMQIDDCHHMIQYGPTERVVDYRDNVWGPLCEELSNFVGFSPFDVEDDDDLELDEDTLELAM